jgi:hypothetical protein
MRISALATFLTVSLARVAAQAAAGPPRPSMIFITIDDLGYGDIGPFGSAAKL